MHRTPEGRSVCRLSMMMDNSSPVMRATGKKICKILSQLSHHCAKASISIRNLCKLNDNGDVSVQNLRQAIETCRVAYYTGTERHWWGEEQIGAVMRHFDYYGTGYVSMNEVELTLARALDLESHQNPTWDETAVSPLLGVDSKDATFLSQTSSFGQQLRSHERHAPRATFSKSRRFARAPKEGDAVPGVGAYLGVSNPPPQYGRDTAKPNQAELRKRQKGMGCSTRPPAAGASPGGLQARMSPSRSTLSSVAPVMSGRNLFRNFLAETDKAETQQRLYGGLPGRTGGVLSSPKLAALQILVKEAANPRAAIPRSSSMGAQSNSKTRSSAAVAIERNLRPLARSPKLPSSQVPHQYDVPSIIGNASDVVHKTLPQWGWSSSTTNLGREPPRIGTDICGRRSPEDVAARQARSIAKHLGRTSAAFYCIRS